MMRKVKALTLLKKAKMKTNTTSFRNKRQKNLKVKIDTPFYKSQSVVKLETLTLKNSQNFQETN